MASVTLNRVSKAFGDVPVLNNIDLDIADGEFLTLVGPSGCGKSTLLRIIAGLETQDAGTVSIGGAGVDHLRPHERRVAMVFQNYALYPHMTVFDNIALPLTIARLSLFERLPFVKHLSTRRLRIMGEIGRDVRNVAEQLRIEGYFDRRPGQLSGGQRQRGSRSAAPWSAIRKRSSWTNRSPTWMRNFASTCAENSPNSRPASA